MKIDIICKSCGIMTGVDLEDDSIILEPCKTCLYHARIEGIELGWNRGYEIAVSERKDALKTFTKRRTKNEKADYD